MLNSKSTPCTTTTRTTAAPITEGKENRSRLITPSWKKSSKFYFKDFRGRIGSKSVFLTPFSHITLLFLSFLTFFRLA